VRVTAVRPLLRADLPAVLAIESASNPSPWREGHFHPFLPPLVGAETSEPPERRRGGVLHRAWVHAEAPAAATEAVGATEGVAATEAPVLGFACAVAVADEVELQGIAVDPTVRRRGIGAALLETLVEWAREAGYRTLHLEVRAGNLPALALYRHFGFVQVGLRRAYYQDNGEDALLLTREIQRAGTPRLSEPGGPQDF
jgi:ribosomal-protein-alanine acetyltransferase